MKYRIIATLVLLIVLAVAYFVFSDGHRTLAPQNDDPGGIVIH